MAKFPKIEITLVEKKGNGFCRQGHKIGDVFDFDTERGKLCPMFMHVAFPHVNAMRFGGVIPSSNSDSECFLCCQDPDVINVFKIKKIGNSISS